MTVHPHWPEWYHIVSVEKTSPLKPVCLPTVKNFFLKIFITLSHDVHFYLFRPKIDSLLIYRMKVNNIYFLFI
jgi:hypothetical protein